MHSVFISSLDFCYSVTDVDRSKCRISCILYVNCSAFSSKQLGQIHTVYPTAYKFQQEKDLPMFGSRVSGYQLTIEAILDAASDNDGTVWCFLSFESYIYYILYFTKVVDQSHVNYNL